LVNERTTGCGYSLCVTTGFACGWNTSSPSRRRTELQRGLLEPVEACRPLILFQLSGPGILCLFEVEHPSVRLLFALSVFPVSGSATCDLACFAWRSRAGTIGRITLDFRAGSGADCCRYSRGPPRTSTTGGRALSSSCARGVDETYETQTLCEDTLDQPAGVPNSGSLSRWPMLVGTTSCLAGTLNSLEIPIDERSPSFATRRIICYYRGGKS